MSKWILIMTIIHLLVLFPGVDCEGKSGPGVSDNFNQQTATQCSHTMSKKYLI